MTQYRSCLIITSSYQGDKCKGNFAYFNITFVALGLKMDILSKISGSNSVEDLAKLLTPHHKFLNQPVNDISCFLGGKVVQVNEQVFVMQFLAPTIFCHSHPPVVQGGIQSAYLVEAMGKAIMYYRTCVGSYKYSGHTLQEFNIDFLRRAEP